MHKLTVKFTATGEVVAMIFSKSPRLSDIFEYKRLYYMVADYDGKFVHVVKVNKHDVEY